MPSEIKTFNICHVIIVTTTALSIALNERIVTGASVVHAASTCATRKACALTPTSSALVQCQAYRHVWIIMARSIESLQ